MTDLEAGEDSRLTAAEKETTIRWANDQDRLHIASEQRAVIRWLRQNPHFDRTWRRLTDGQVVAISGTLPVGAMLLKGKPRKSNQPARTLGELPEEDDE